MRALSNFFVCLGLFLSLFIISGFSQPTPLTDTLNEAWRYLDIEAREQEIDLSLLLKTSMDAIAEPPSLAHEPSDNKIHQLFMQFFNDSWVGVNELFPEHAAALYSRFLLNLPRANTINARAHPRMPLVYVGVGFLRTWFTFMPLEDHFSDLVLIDQDAVICFCNALQKLILLMSPSVEDYRLLQSLFSEGMEPDGYLESVLTLSINYWVNRFKDAGEPLSWDNQHRLRIIYTGYSLMRSLIIDTIDQNKKKASQDIRYNLPTGLLDAWVNGDIGDAYYKRLKRMVEEGRVHIIQEHIEAESPRLCNQLIALCEARGVRLGMIDLSNMFTLPQLENWIADKTFDDEQLKYINPLDFFKFIQHLALLKSTDGHFLGVPIVTPSTIFVGTTWQHTPNNTDLFHPSTALLHWAISLSDLRLCQRTFVAMKADDVWVQCSEEELNARLAQWHRLHQPEPVEGLETVFTEEETPSASNIRTVRTESARGGAPSACLPPWGGYAATK